MYEIPKWAKPLIDKLPKEKPSSEEMLELFQEAIETGEIAPHPVFKHVVCPNCKAPAKDFEEKLTGDDVHNIMVVKCPHCGWSDWEEV